MTTFDDGAHCPRGPHEALRAAKNAVPRGDALEVIARCTHAPLAYRNPKRVEGHVREPRDTLRYP